VPAEGFLKQLLRPILVDGKLLFHENSALVKESSYGERVFLDVPAKAQESKTSKQTLVGLLLPLVKKPVPWP
jgi:hypothetical protein